MILSLYNKAHVNYVLITSAYFYCNAFSVFCYLELLSGCLIRLGCRNKLPQTEWFKPQKLFLTVQEPGESKIKSSQPSVLVCTCLSSLVSSCGQGQKLLFLLIRAPIPFVREPPSQLNYLQKAPPPIPLHWGWRFAFKHMNLEGGMNIQSITLA